MNDKVYYRVRKHPTFENEFQLLECNIQDTYYEDTKEKAINKMKNFLLDSIETAIEDLFQAKECKKAFDEWIKNNE